MPIDEQELNSQRDSRADTDMLAEIATPADVATPSDEASRYTTTILEAPTYVSNGHTTGNGRNGHANGSNGHTNGNGNGNGHAESLAETVTIYEAAAADEAEADEAPLITNHQSLITPPTARLRHYPRSHTGIKHGARVSATQTRIDSAQQRRMAQVAVAGGRRGGTPRGAVSRSASASRRYPSFMLRQLNAAPKKRSGGAKWLLIVALLFFLIFSAGVGGVIGGLFVYARDLPPVANLAAKGSSFETTRIYDRNGVLLTEIYGEGKRTYVPLNKISKYVIDATIATEDSSFYTNLGIEPAAFLRAFFINFSGRGSSGASTITQQLVRRILLTDQQYQVSIDRKVKEAILAVQAAQTYSKDQILEMYLNEIYYGNLAYGIEAASEAYFSKHANELSLPEAAMLAGLPQSPSYYDPTQNFDVAKARQRIVLQLMMKSGKITAQQEQDAEAAPILLHPGKSDVKAPHFVQYVKEYLEAQYGPDAVSKGGLVVTTTLDLKVQEMAEKVAVERIDALRELSATNAAMVVIKPDTGEILAMVGSVDYNDLVHGGQVNVATRERQPGSSLKPIVYAAAFQKGWNPATSVLDVDTVFGYKRRDAYEPHNYDLEDHGWVTVRTALANSFNIPAVKALQFAGVQETLDLAHAMGIRKGLYRSTDWYGLALALGGGEVTLLEETNAYATFANAGKYVPVSPILKMTDSRGQVIQAIDPHPAGEAVLDPGIAYQMSSILSDNKARTRMFGPNSPLKVSFPAAAKTGTTDDNKDSWTMGYTPNLVVGVWVGNNDSSKMKAVTGAKGAAYIWHDFMENFYANPDFRRIISYNLPGQVLASDFTKPQNVVRDTICTVAKGDTTDYFIAGKVPSDCKGYKDPPDNKVKGYSGTSTTKPKATPTPVTGAGSGSGSGSDGGSGGTRPKPNNNGEGSGNGSGGGNVTPPDGGTSPPPATPAPFDPAPTYSAPVNPAPPPDNNPPPSNNPPPVENTPVPSNNNPRNQPDENPRGGG